MTDKENALEPRVMGRPTKYSEELADAICELVVRGMSMRKICELDAMPVEDTVYSWLAKYPYFSEKYTEAVQHRTNKYLEECVDLADNMPDGIMFLGLDGRLFERWEVMGLTPKERVEAQLIPVGLSTELVNKRKLQIETRIKAAARMHPRKYGDKLQTENKTEQVNLNANLPDLEGVDDEKLIAARKLLFGG